MRQQRRPNRKRREFVGCPICGVEFCRLTLDQRWCSKDCSQHAKRLTGRAPPKRQIAAKPRS
jgi:hypothetical protein